MGDDEHDAWVEGQRNDGAVPSLLASPYPFCIHFGESAMIEWLVVLVGTYVIACYAWWAWKDTRRRSED